MNLVKSFATVSFYTMLSRILGFLRDILIAKYVGAGPISDAFFVAFRYPNLFRRLFAEGAFSAAFIPLYTGHKKQSLEEAHIFASQIMGLMLLFLIPFTLCAQLFMPWLIYLISPGFHNDPTRLSWAVSFSQICFPYLMFMSLIALLSGILNSIHKFAMAAAAPIMMNVILILSLYLLTPFFANEGYALSWGVFIAGIVQFLLMLTSTHKHNLTPKLVRPRFSPEIKQFFAVLGPGILGVGVMQINMVIGTVLASYIPKAVSYLYYADRLNQLPLGMIGIALGTVLLPVLSKELQEEDKTKGFDTLNHGIYLALLLTLPATGALIVIAYPIIDCLFQRGAFDATTTKATALCLQAYAVGLPAYVLMKVLNPVFFAVKNTKTPMQLSLVAITANIILSLILIPYLSYIGIALASSLAAWFNFICSYILLRRKNLVQIKQHHLYKWMHIGLCALLMTGFLYVMHAYILPQFDFHKVLTLIILIIISLASYALIMPKQDIKRFLKRR